jgi:cysteine-S-conjugate beta-lyase
VKDETRVVTAGRDPKANFGIVNPPVYHASTVLFPTVAALESASPAAGGVYYGRYGTPTTFALEEAVASLDGPDCRTVALGSGKAAIVMTLLALLRPGDHLLMVDSVYAPTRAACDGLLAELGIATTYYPPTIGAGIAELIRPETKAVFTESPGSLTFEVQDIPAIAAAAHAAGALVLMDNTWATPLLFKAIEHGVDVSIQAATKYIGGHADVMMGTVTARGELFARLRRGIDQFGSPPGPDDCYLALRGLRTLAVRLQRHQSTGLQLARWLQQRPEVTEVIHPALAEHPDHAIWVRDFDGASGLFGFRLSPDYDEAALTRMLDGMSLFGMGYSFGAFESLLIPAELAAYRAEVQPPGVLMRLHAGLEHPDDLQADLEAGFARLNG